MMNFFTSELASLARTPHLLSEIIKDRPDSWLDSRHAEDCLSPREVLGHFIIGERDDWIPRVLHILELGESSPFKPFNVQGGNEMSYALSVESLLDVFSKERKKSLEVLYSLELTEADLKKTGMHPKFGRVTMGELLACWVSHDLYHLGQIFKSFSAPFKERIGPWQEFLNLPNFN